MKNKLLLSSALVGSLALASAAVAETKITGSAAYTYAAGSSGTAAASAQGAGSELQIDVANSGDLNIGGLTYKAGFSMESDGNESADWGEGNFFSVVSGNTEVMWNKDKAPSVSQSAAPRVGQQLSTQAASTGAAVYDYSPGNMHKNTSWNLAVLQKTDVGNFAVTYSPKFNDGGLAANDAIAASTQDGGSAYDLLYNGNLGVDGLSAVAGYSKLNKQTGAVDDDVVKQLGIGYNFGQFAAGVTRAKHTDTASLDTTQTEYGVTFAANDNLSLGILHAAADEDGTTAKEKLTSATIAYNLGGAVFETYYLKLENADGDNTAKDVEKVAARISTKF